MLFRSSTSRALIPEAGYLVGNFNNSDSYLDLDENVIRKRLTVKVGLHFSLKYPVDLEEL